MDEQSCAACHEATAVYTDTLVCSFDTVEEWRQSPYPAKGQSCTHCHMPAVSRPVAVGGPVRHSRRHLFLGSKIPKEKGLAESQRDFYDLYASGLSVEILPSHSPSPTATTVPVKLALKNASAGHMLPTGDPERFILVKAQLLDSASAVMDQKTYRIGQEWVWNPKARKISDNRLKPLERREIEMHFQNPRRTRSPRVRVIVENWRMSEQNAAYHKLTDVYPLSTVVLRIE